ncbi:MAG: hypothetical protein RMK57_12520 [Bryobacterales bacterium]|nr:hypothetical protein [Bryobacteraceae bacterium]MDW8355340.1 hypothetical protein [Bryobacterales bacterium]
MTGDLRQLLANLRERAREELHAAWRMHVARVEEQLAAGWPDHIAQVVDRRFEELAAALGAEWSRRVVALGRQLERQVSEKLNHAARRMRQAGSWDEVLAALLDAAAERGGLVCLWRLEGEHFRCVGTRGFPGETHDAIMAMRIALRSAPALVQALEGQTLVAAATAGELSEALATALGQPDGVKVYLFPVLAGAKEKAVLLVAGREEPADVGALELLTWIAAAVRAIPTPHRAVEQWLALPEAEREAHAQAQRFARARVAAMRLHRWQAVEMGRRSRNIYGQLQNEIDGAREEYWERFGTCTSMVDYLHRELVSVLANHDESLLGADYPGPLV